MKKIFFISLFTLLLSSGCQEKDNSENNSSIIKIAKVNNHIITNKIFGKNYSIFTKLNNLQKKQLIDKLINDELLVQYTIAKYPHKKLFNIKDENIRVKKSLKVLEEKLTLKIIKEIKDKNLSFNYYKRHKQDYFHDELFQASNILVRSKQEAINIINILEKSLDFNATFIKLTKEKSIDKVAKNGGYLGYFKKDIMVKSFKKALENLKVNTYTHTPIKTRYGYHIIYLHSILKKGYFPFDKKLKQKITLFLLKKELNNYIKIKIHKLKKDANIIIY